MFIINKSALDAHWGHHFIEPFIVFLKVGNKFYGKASFVKAPKTLNTSQNPPSLNDVVWLSFQCILRRFYIKVLIINKSALKAHWDHDFIESFIVFLKAGNKFFGKASFLRKKTKYFSSPLCYKYSAFFCQKRLLL